MRNRWISLVAAAAVVGGALNAAGGTLTGAAAQDNVVVVPDGELVEGRAFVEVMRRGRPVIVTPDRRETIVLQGDNSVVIDRDGGGTRSTGSWVVRDEMYCMTHGDVAERCYKVYRTAPDRYTLWDPETRSRQVIVIEGSPR